MQSNENTYVDIMLQSLTKKLAVLDAIEVQNVRQKDILEDHSSSVDDFDETVEEKSRLIDQLDLLDDGFDKLYQRVCEQLDENRAQYADQILRMQELIKQIVEKSMDLQKQEARNKELMTMRFAYVRKAAKSLRTNSKITSEYYKTMNKSTFVDPQFMDNKH